MTSLTPAEANTVWTALKAARTGGATLDQLLAAYPLASKGATPATLAELRQHIRKQLPGPSYPAVLAGVGIGVVAGLITNGLLNLTTFGQFRPLSRYLGPQPRKT